MTATSWIVLVGVLSLLWGVGGWSLWRTMRDEGRKARLLHRYGSVDRFHPRAEADLEDWLRENAADPYASMARARLDETRRHRASGNPTLYPRSEAHRDGQGA
jgi:ABC-type nickel/cobalt efflux system permease component RcnA